MKKYLVGGTSKKKLFEVAYFITAGEISGTAYTKVIAADIIEAAEIIISMMKINATDIEYINEYKCETVIG